MTELPLENIRYYDRVRDRLVYLGRAATEEAWDEWWKTDSLRGTITGPRN